MPPADVDWNKLNRYLSRTDRDQEGVRLSTGPLRNRCVRRGKVRENLKESQEQTQSASWNGAPYRSGEFWKAKVLPVVA